MHKNLSHCGGNVVCRLGDPPQAQNPVLQDSISSLQFAVTVGIHDGVHSLLLLAQGAVTEAVGLIIRHILPGENGVDRNGMRLIYRAENRVDGADFSAVIFDTLNALIQGFSGGGCSQQQQDILVLYHQLHIVTKNQLAAGMEFRGSDIDGLMLIDRTDSGFVSSSARYAPITSQPSRHTMVSTIL